MPPTVGLEILELAAGVAVKLSFPKHQVSGPEVASVAGLLWWPFSGPKHYPYPWKEAAAVWARHQKPAMA